MILDKFIINSKTNDKEYAKQYFYVYKSEGMEASLIIHKLVLSNNFELYSGFKLLKQFKDKGLFWQSFSIKLSTLKIVIDLLKKK